jgi:hypothetical protein
MLALFSTEWRGVAHPRFRDAPRPERAPRLPMRRAVQQADAEGKAGIDRAEAERQRDCVKASADVDRKKR